MTTVAVVGVIAGLILLARGLGGYRSLVRVGDTSTSTIASLAAGEVRVSGIVEPAELTLVSLLQSVPCVYYRATVGSDQERRGLGDGYEEEQSIGFRIRDATGSLRVFPRGARFDAPVRFESEADASGDEPAGLAIRQGGSTGPAEIDDAVARRRAADGRRRRAPRAIRRDSAAGVVGGRTASPGWSRAIRSRSSGGHSPSPTSRTRPGPMSAAARIRSSTTRRSPPTSPRRGPTGTLVDDPAAAWGNAAIPGFGIGRPVVAPVIDPAANSLPLRRRRGRGPCRANVPHRTRDADPRGVG